jgi:Uma2 family endonuclease
MDLPDAAPGVYDPETHPPFRLKRDEFFAMVDAGILADRAVELIDGMLVRMSPVGQDHDRAVAVLTQHFRFIRAIDIAVAPTLPLSNAYVVEPDFLLLRPDHSLAGGHPQLADVRLIIEVSDTSLRKDLGPKRDVYAAAGIAEYWVVNLAGQRVLVHREPKDGVYPQPAEFTEDDRVAPGVLPDAALRVGDLLP